MPSKAENMIQRLAGALAVLAAAAVVGSCATVPRAVVPMARIPPGQCQPFYYYRLPKYSSQCSLTSAYYTAEGRKAHELTCCG